MCFNLGDRTMSNFYSGIGRNSIAEDPRDSLPDYEEIAEREVIDHLNDVGTTDQIQDENEWFKDFIVNADGEFLEEIVSFFKEMANQQYAGERGTDPRFIKARYALDAYKEKRTQAKIEQLKKAA